MLARNTKGRRWTADEVTAELSPDDSRIRDRFLKALNKWPLWARVIGIAGIQDRRDAELMLTAQRQKWLVFVLPPDAKKLSDTVLLRGGPWRAPVS